MFLGRRSRLEREADLTTICEPTVQEMWNPLKTSQPNRPPRPVTVIAFLLLHEHVSCILLGYFTVLSEPD
jgi:hypothetical protein